MDFEEVDFDTNFITVSLSNNLVQLSLNSVNIFNNQWFYNSRNSPSDNLHFFSPINFLIFLIQKHQLWLVSHGSRRDLSYKLDFKRWIDRMWTTPYFPRQMRRPTAWKITLEGYAAEREWPRNQEGLVSLFGIFIERQVSVRPTCSYLSNPVIRSSMSSVPWATISFAYTTDLGGPLRSPTQSTNPPTHQAHY